MARTRHHQAGYVFRKGSNWYVRYREDVQLENGSVQRIQKCHKLAEASGQYRTRDAAEELAEEFIRSVNLGDVRPESTMSLNRFIEDCYLLYVEQQKRRSTYCGYKNLWLRYVQPNGGVALREVRTFEAEQMLKDIARRENLSRTTLDQALPERGVSLCAPPRRVYRILENVKIPYSRRSSKSSASADRNRTP